MNININNNININTNNIININTNNIINNDINNNINNYINNIDTHTLTTLTKADLVQVLMNQLKLKKWYAQALVETIFEEIRESLLAGQDITLSGFGNFKIRHKTPRIGCNPRTGELVPIHARTVVSFSPSVQLKALINY